MGFGCGAWLFKSWGPGQTPAWSTVARLLPWGGARLLRLPCHTPLPWKLWMPGPCSRTCCAPWQCWHVTAHSGVCTLLCALHSSCTQGQLRASRLVSLRQELVIMFVRSCLRLLQDERSRQQVTVRAVVTGAGIVLAWAPGCSRCSLLPQMLL